ncbi:hypothetical protein ACQCVK_14670 [Rossellomorea vietnamensis]|nr:MULTISPECIES: hypothetical protein [Rossellomorea]
MNKPLTKLSYDDIDKLLQPADQDLFHNINWQFISEEEMETLLRTP